MGCSREILLILLAVAYPPKSEKKPLTPGQRIELKALEARRGLTQGSAKIRVRTKGDAPTGRSEHDFTYDIEFSGPRIRCKQTDNKHGTQRLRIYTGAEYISVDDAGRRVSVDDPKLASVGAKYALIDPRLLGCFAVSVGVIAHHRQLSLERLSQPDRIGESVKSEKLNGIPVKHIHYRLSHGAVVDWWIAPSQNSAVLKFQVVGKGGENQILDAKYEKQPKGIWYPKKLTFRSKSKVSKKEEAVEVISSNFRRTVKLDRFSLESLGLKPGAEVTKNGRRMIWDGNRLKKP